MKWVKERAGRYLLDGTDYAVESDGYPASNSVSAEIGTGYEGFTGGEWASLHVSTDDNLDWFPTMREARADAERRHRADLARAECSP